MSNNHNKTALESYRRNRDEILQRRRDARRAARPQIRGPRYWLTPPDLYARLNAKYNFDFDPCPYPRPEGFNSLAKNVEWGKSNWVNPPFKLIDAPFGGIAKFADRAIAESKQGKKSVFILPVSTGIAKLLAAGGKIVGCEKVAFLEKDTHTPNPAPQWQVIIEI